MIDWSRVLELRDEIGADGFSEVVALFLDEVEEAIDLLRDQPCPADLEQKLHFLKGSAVSLGFSEFSELCGDGEVAARTGSPADVDVSAVIASFDASKASFLDQLSVRLAA